VVQVVLLFEVLSRVTAYSYVSVITVSYLIDQIKLRLTLDSFELQIPTRSHNPTKYRPRFQPLCSPETPLNPTTSERIVHLLSLTSIQCAVIPRNEPLVLSAVHPSAVEEILPGAFCSFIQRLEDWSRLSYYSPLSAFSDLLTTQQTCYGYISTRHVCWANPQSSPLVSLPQGSYEKRPYLPRPVPKNARQYINHLFSSHLPGHRRQQIWLLRPEPLLACTVWGGPHPRMSHPTSLVSLLSDCALIASIIVEVMHGGSRVCPHPYSVVYTARNVAGYVPYSLNCLQYRTSFSLQYALPVPCLPYDIGKSSCMIWT